MSDVIDAAVSRLSARIGDGFDGVALFVIPGEGSIVVDSAGVRAGEAEADVTLTATAEVFEQLLAGELNPTAAFMTGKLAIEGSMGMAMKVGAALTS